MAINAESFLSGYKKKEATNYIGQVNYQAQQNQPTQSTQQSQNNGGLLGGIGYLGEKTALGFMNSIEGIWDYSASALAKLFGQDDWAEQQLQNDWMNYNHADEWYNPSQGMQVAGDVFGGIGTSLPAIAGVAAGAAIATASGGTLSPIAAGLIGASISGLGAAGNATKEAYQKTGELTGKEFGYGALVGATEGAVEGISNIIGFGTGAAVKGVTRALGKEVTKGVARDSFIKTIGKSFIGEAFEEGLTEFINPYWARATYDPNAENASAQQIAYSAVIGGLSGVVMGGAPHSVQSVVNVRKGNQLVQNGQVQEILGTAQTISQYEKTNPTQLEGFRYVDEIYTKLEKSLAKTNGEVRTLAQKQLLGELSRANTYAVVSPILSRSAENIYANAETIAERANAFGYTDANGNKLTFTAEELRKGIDPKNRNSLIEALKTNDVLRTLVLNDALGQITMNNQAYAQDMLIGKQIGSTADLQRFLATSTEQERKALGDRLGISEKDWSTITNDELIAIIGNWAKNGGVQQYQQELAELNRMKTIQGKGTIDALPESFADLKGSARFTTSDNDIAISRNGDGYKVYDFKNNSVSRRLTEQEATEYTRSLNKRTQETELQRATKEAHEFARKHIKGYTKLNANAQRAIQAMIRQARSLNVDEKNIITIGNIACHSGLDIQFSSMLDDTEKGAYMVGKNTIVLNAKRLETTKQGRSVVRMTLLHELVHAMYQKNGNKNFLKGIANWVRKNLPEFAKNLEYKYNRHDELVDTDGKAVSEEAQRTLDSEERKDLFDDEIVANYFEQVLDDKIMDDIFAEKPSLLQRIIGGLTRMFKHYSQADKQAQAESKKMIDTFRAMFNNYAVEHYQYNGLATASNSEGRFAISEGLVINGSQAGWTDKRLDEMIEYYGASNPNYSQAFVTWVNPTDFLNATTRNQTARRRIKTETGELDIDKMRAESQTPTLWVDLERKKILSHEGRHRLTALANAGVNSVAVVIVPSSTSFDKYHAQIIEQGIDFKGQTFNYVDKEGNYRSGTSRHHIITSELIPLNNSHRDRLQQFTSKQSKYRYSLEDTQRIDQQYQNAVENGDTETQRKLIEQSARMNGYDTPVLYHGTRNFGFTEFNNGLVFTSTDSGESSLYASNKGERDIQSKHFKDDGTKETLLSHLKQFVDKRYEFATEKDLIDLMLLRRKQAQKIADKMDKEVPTSEIEAFEKAVPSEYRDAFENVYNCVYDLLFDEGDTEWALKSLKKESSWSDLERNESNLSKVKQFLQEHTELADNKQYQKLQYIFSGFEFSDFLIYCQSLKKTLTHSNGQLFKRPSPVEEGAYSIINEDIAREGLEAIRDDNNGVYQLYGKLGSNPYVIDAHGSYWTNIKTPNGVMTTDQIGVWAKENGYTSVVIKNVVDPNNRADDYIFFDSSALKSADLVTYDGNGKVIPLSQRFDSTKDDIRYSLNDPNQISMFDEVPQDVPLQTGMWDGTNTTATQNGAETTNRVTEASKLAREFIEAVNKKYWRVDSVFKYIEEHPQLNFIERIYSKDASAVNDLKQWLNDIDDIRLLEDLMYFMKESYNDKGKETKVDWDKLKRTTIAPYRGATRTFANAVKNRIEAINTSINNGENLNIKNGEVSLDYVRNLYSRLNSNSEMVEFAEKVFDKAYSLGINIRFINSTMDSDTYGKSIGDMVEYKTSYFNSTGHNNQHKANTLLHELIHACTAYVMYAGEYDVKLTDSKLSKANSGISKIYYKILRDTDFKGEYGLKSPSEMVAELSNPEFVSKLKKKSLFEEIVDWICKIFGFRRGTSAYDNAKVCVDYILDNPDIEAYKKYALTQREIAHTYTNDPSFGYTEVNGQRRYSLEDAPKITSNEYDFRYSLIEAPRIANAQTKHLNNPDKKSYVEADVLVSAQEIIDAMVKEMSDYTDMLPEDKIGNTIISNSSYSKTIENTTICFRTLAYNKMVEDVQRELGRPLSMEESFLVSQKLYDIAIDPQCLYCYVALDRKSYNSFLLSYFNQRDNVINTWNDYKQNQSKYGYLGKKEFKDKLYEFFLRNNVDVLIEGETYIDENGREKKKKLNPKRADTANMRSRFESWLKLADMEESDRISLSMVATKENRLKTSKDSKYSKQLEDALEYAQSASWAKIERDYVAYGGEILKMSDNTVKNLNKHYGLRFYSFSDYTGAFIVENMQQITDASIKGLKGLAYTKDIDFVKIFAPTGININISVFVKKYTDKNGNEFYDIDKSQSAVFDTFEELLEMRNKYPNVGIVAVATEDNACKWAMQQEWSDVVIPFHTVRTGDNIAEFYKWSNYKGMQADKLIDEEKWQRYLKSIGRSPNSKLSKDVYPSDHNNDYATYMHLCEERGLQHRFSQFLPEKSGLTPEQYMKLVNETRMSDRDSRPMQPIFDLDAAKTSFGEFIKRGGYFNGYYKKGVDYAGAVKQVSTDIRDGKRANEVQYGRQDITYEGHKTISDKFRKSGRSHMRHALADAPQINTRYYSRQEAAKVADDIIETINYGEILGEDEAMKYQKGKVIDYLFDKLNSTTTIEDRKQVAKEIAQYVMDNVSISKIVNGDDADIYDAIHVLSRDGLGQYLHNVNLRYIQAELGDDARKLNLLWGTREGGFTADQIAQQLEEVGIYIEGNNEADIFKNMVKLYERARNTINDAKKKTPLSAYNERELQIIRSGIIMAVMGGFEDYGRKDASLTKLLQALKTENKALLQQLNQEIEKGSQLLNQAIAINNETKDRLNKVISDLNETISQLTERTKHEARVYDKVIDLQRISRREYVPADTYIAPEIKLPLKGLEKIHSRRDLIKPETRKIVAKFGDFYNKNNPLLYDETEDGFNYVDEDVIRAIDFLKENANSTEPLTNEEIQAVDVVLGGALKLYRTYNTVFLNGKKENLTNLANSAVEISRGAPSHVGKGFFSKLFNWTMTTSEPRVVFKTLDGFDDGGIVTRMFNDITDGETKANAQFMAFMNPFDNFFAKHKGYRNRLVKKYINVNGHDLNIGQAITLWQLSQREQAVEGLYTSGFAYYDKKGNKKSVMVTESDISALGSAFSDADRDFISLVNQFFNIESKRVKSEADMEILGYTNATEDFYFPIKRDSSTIRNNVTKGFASMNWENVYSFSFNKDVKKGSKNKLFVDNVFDVISKHAAQMSIYAHLTVPIKTFQQVYSKNIGTKENVVTLRRVLNEEVWDGAERYLQKFFSDLQGNNATRNGIIERMRGMYAKYQLGANAKVIVSQITSYPTAGIMLDAGCLAKGFTMKIDHTEMDKYCDYARVRNYDKGIVRAEGVIDKVSKIGDVLTRPIQWTDRFTIGRLWNACKLQVEKNQGYALGTEENKVAAGKLLEEVIRNTQPNYTNTERSALMRSESDIMRAFTMFGSVPLKQLSRLVECFGEISVYRAKKKKGTLTAKEKVAYAKAKKKLGRTLASITIANLMYVMVGQFFKWLYDKEREDKNGNEISVVQDILNDFTGTTIGMFPIVKDIYGFFANDYEISSFAYDTINGVLESSQALYNLTAKAVAGESVDQTEMMRTFRNSIYAVGQVTGIPFRNINNTIVGLTKRFNPSVAYSYNSMFYNANYTEDINKAFSKGDTKLAQDIMGMLMKERVGTGLSEYSLNAISPLYEAGYSVLPYGVPQTITYTDSNNETQEIKLNRSQTSVFTNAYSQSNQAIEKLVKSNSFKALDEQANAKAVKSIYDAYYNSAKAQITGQEYSSKLADLSRFFDISELAPILAQLSIIESDYDKKGNIINGSKKKKAIAYVSSLNNLNNAEKIFILTYKGYTLNNTEYRLWSKDKVESTLRAYIKKLNVSTTEKQAIAQQCNIEL